jgi:HEAT repeat protein
MLAAAPFLAFSLSLISTSAPVPQEAPQVPGAYRGPEVERTLGADVEHQIAGSLGLAFRRTGWEFWFEHERELLFRGEPDFPARAVGEDGRYGSEAWSVQRHELLLSSLPLMVEALKAEEPAVREAAALALGRIGYPASHELLSQALADPDPAVRQAVCLGLGLLATPEGEAALRDRLQDESLSASERAFAALGLGLSGRTGAGSTLKLQVLGLGTKDSAATDPLLAQALVIAAGVHGSRDFVPMLLDLDVRLTETDDPAALRLRVCVFQALGGLGDVRASVAIAAALENARGDLARAAAQSLGRLGELSAVLPLASKVRSSHDEECRALCMIAIGRIGGNRAIEELNRLKPSAGTNEEVHAAWLIANGLARSKDSYERMRNTVLAGARGSQAAEPVEASARSGEETLRSAAAVSLGLFGNPQAMEALTLALDSAQDGDPVFQGYLTTAIGLLRTPEGEQCLLNMAAEASDLQVEARRGLAMGLGFCSSEQSGLALARLLVTDPSAEVRWAGARALAYARSNDALRVLAEELHTCLESKQVPARAAHLLLGLGFLGDVHQGATLDSLVAGMDFLQESRLLDALRGY